MKKHTVQANGDVLATAVEKRMLELGMFPILNDPFLYKTYYIFCVHCQKYNICKT